MINLTRKTWLAVACLCVALTAPLHADAAGEKIKSVGSKYNATSPIGTNLTGIVDWTSEWAFADPFKQARAWVSSSGDNWDDGRQVAVDEHGWVKYLLPGQIARTVMFWTDNGHYPGGKYQVFYEGEGKLITSTQRIVAAEPGKLTLWVDPKKGGIELILVETNPKNYLRNIKIVMPPNGCGPEFKSPCDIPAVDTSKLATPFLPAFLDSIKSYRVLRFMDWIGTNNSIIRTYADRPKVDDATYTVKGVPVEVMVDLANTVKADPWFNIPHMADDEYVEKYAEYVRDHLDPDRLVYIEYSNEVWNTMFDQAHYASQLGEKLNLSSNGFEGQLRYYSRRSVEIFRIWEKVFGGTSRLVRVMGSQAANYWVSETVLGYDDAYKETDALAIAPYFGGYMGAAEEEARVQDMTPEAAIQELNGRGLAEVKDWLVQQKKVADYFNVDMIAYEGGPHMVGIGNVVNNDRITDLFFAVNRDPAMKALYLAYLNQWKEMGGGMFMQFVNTSSFSKWGCWGANEYLAQPLSEAPKADALQTFIRSYPTQ